MPPQLLRSTNPFVRVGDEHEETIEVTLTRCVDVAACDEAATGELSDGLQHPVTHAGWTMRRHQHRLLDQGGDPVLQRSVVARVPDMSLGAGGNGDRAGEVEIADEHGQRLKHSLLVIVEQVVGPLDRTQQALLTASARPTTSQHSKAIVDSVTQVIEAEHDQPRRGELDRERQPVEMTDHLADDPPLAFIRRE